MKQVSTSSTVCLSEVESENEPSGGEPFLSGIQTSFLENERMEDYPRDRMKKPPALDSVLPQSTHGDGYLRPLEERTVWRRIRSWICKAINFLRDMKKEQFLHSLYGMSFLSLFITFVTFFYVNIVTFTILLRMSAITRPDCIYLDWIPLTKIEHGWWAGLFTLSWTTFSTVGYGNTTPTPNMSYDGDGDCSATNLILMIEAFIGVVYVGACSAILFTKVLRTQSPAQVQFSNGMIVRFRPGVVNPLEDETKPKASLDLSPSSSLGGNKSYDEGDNDNSMEEVETKGGMHTISEDKEHHGIVKKAQYPILEFRILNKMHGRRCCELMDAELNCLASVRAVGGEKEDRAELGKGKGERMMRRIFVDVDLVNNSHPFFRRVWTAVHLLDEESPLLKKKVRDKIKENGGWDSKDFTNEALRKSLNFYEIVVSINGVSRQTESHVYAQKIYDRSDVVVGFQFVNILEKKGGSVKVKSEYLDHIVKQDEDG